jgi:hypothetical protein
VRLQRRRRRASLPRVTVPAAPPPVSATHAAAAWQAVHARADIQFAPLSPPAAPPYQTSPWLRALLDWLARHLGPPVQWVVQHWTGVEIAAAIVVALVVALVGWRMWVLRERRQAPAAETYDWRPDAALARALLADADRLAAAGRFDEATHLLLRRSFDDIATAHPEWLTPASTAREIAWASALPEAARGAFAVIAGEVERSRYALHPLALPDWTRAREAYARFAGAA